MFSCHRAIVAAIGFLFFISGVCAAQSSPVSWKNPGKTSPKTVSDTIALKQTLTEGVQRHILVQFKGIPNEKERDTLKQSGIALLSYLGENAYFATLVPSKAALATAETNGIAAIGEILPDWKLHPLLANGAVPDYARYLPKASDDAKETASLAVVQVLFHPNIPVKQLAAAIVARYGGFLQSTLELINIAMAVLPEDAIPALAMDDAVQWIEPPLPKLGPNNDSNRSITQVDTLRTAPYNLNGAGITVLVFDGGTAYAGHQDFGGRLTVHDSSGTDAHPTHVAGTIGGSGAASGGLYRGMAPGVQLLSYGLEGDGGDDWLYTDPCDIETDYNEAINTYNAMVSNNSIGTNVAWNGFPCSWEGDYSTTDILIDAMVRGSLGRTMRIVWSNGNERGGACGSDYHTTAPPACAKNHITVGALNSNDDSMTEFSSWGPADDGRIKPDLCGPGCQSGNDEGVTSCSDEGPTSYTTMCGTSMSGPTVTGICALLLQDWRALYPSAPLPRNSTLKTFLTHTAVDLGNPGPDYQFGYGSVRAREAVDLLRSGNFIEDTLAQGENDAVFVLVFPSDHTLKATLAWDDYPGTANTIPELVNDLDIIAIEPDGLTIHYPWTLDPANPATPAARTQADHVNNIEQIYVENPTPGRWRLQISGHAVPQGPQPYSLAATPTLSTASEQGAIMLDATRYACDATVAVRVADTGLNQNPAAAETVSVSLQSSHDPVPEPLVLTEMADDASIFQGTLSLSSTASPAPGALTVADGDTITATYLDVNDGAGGVNVQVTATALADCQPPQLTGSAIANLGSNEATINVTFNEPAFITIHYGAACGALNHSTGQFTGAGTASITLQELTQLTTYYFAIEMTDTAGNTATDTNGGACYSFTTMDFRDYFTELNAPHTLQYKTLCFIPDHSISYYRACLEDATAFPTNPSGGTTLSLSDDSYAAVNLSNSQTVSLYGTSYSTFYVSSNGYITFGAGSSSLSESYESHFSMPRVAALFDDLFPSGDISWRQLADRVAITYDTVDKSAASDSALKERNETQDNENNPGDNASGGEKGVNSFQIELLFNGEIHITFLTIENTDGLTGLSSGHGVPADFVPSDLSAYGICIWDPLIVTPDDDITLLACPGTPVTCADCSLENNSDAPLLWEAETGDTWAAFSATSGTIPARDSIQLSLCADTTALAPGIHTTSFVITNTGTGYSYQQNFILRLAETPQLPASPIPSNAATNVWVMPQLSWTSNECAASPVRFDVYLGKLPNTQELAASNLDSPEFTSGLLDSNTFYYWHVVSHNECGSAPGPLWTFTTGDCIPDPPANLTPSNGLTGVDALPEFRWEENAITQSAKGSVSILSFNKYADLDQEYQNMFSALDTYFSDYSLAETTAETPSELATALAGKHILLFPEQENWSASGMVAFGTNNATVLREFVEAGGVIIACDVTPENGMSALLNAAGLVTGVGVVENINGNTVNTVPGHALTEGMPSTFQAANATMYYSAFPDGVPLVTYSSAPSYTVAGVKEIGQGAVVLMGWDYYEYNDALARLLANAVQLETSPLRITFSLYLGEAPSAMTLLADNLTEPFYVLETPLQSTTPYCWRVEASNDCGTTPGDIWTFTTGDFLPGTPAQPSPSDGAADQWIFQKLTWTCTADSLCPNQYDLYLGNSTSTLELAAQNLNAPAYSTDALTPERQYYWQIVAHNCTGSVTGPLWTFTTGACEPNAPINPAPPDTATDIPLRLNLSWEANQPEKGNELIHVLAFNGYADLAQEYANTLTALSQTVTGYDLTEIADTTASALKTALVGKNVFLFPEQEKWSSGGLDAYGAATADIFQEFVSNGGIFIACHNMPEGGVQAFLDSSGLMPGVGAKVGINSGPVSTVTSHALAAGLPSSFYVDGNSGYYTVIPDSDPILTFSSYPVAASRTIGKGFVVLLGFDFAWYTSEQVQLLANAVQAAPHTSVCPLTFDLQFGTNPAKLPAIVKGLTDTSYTTGWLLPNTTYYWRAIPANCCGLGGSPILSFTTNDGLPPAPIPLEPANAAANIQETTTLTWELAAEPLLQVVFDFYLGLSPTTMQRLAAGLTEPAETIENLLPGATYYWQIVSQNSYGTTSGPIQFFKTADCVAESATAPSPPDQASGIAELPTLSWLPPAELYCVESPRYDIYFGTNPEALPRVTINQETPQWIPAPLTPDMAYYWKIVTHTCCETIPGPVWTFTTASCDAPAPETPSPADGDTAASLAAELSWSTAPIAFCANDSRYDLYLGAASETPALIASGLQTTTFTMPPLPPNGTYAWYVVNKSCCGDVPGPLWTFSTGDAAEYLTEAFESGAMDLAFTQATFTPQDTTYQLCLQPAESLPVSTSAPIHLDDDDFQGLFLANAFQLFNTAYSAVYVGSNGRMTFQAPSADHSGAYSGHFDLPSISAFFTDLNPEAGGDISWTQTLDEVAVTFANVPAYDSQETVTFQLELFHTGIIRITWLDMGALHGIVGLSPGGGIPADFYPSDLSASPACDTPEGEGEGEGQGEGGVTSGCLSSQNVPISLPDFVQMGSQLFVQETGRIADVNVFLEIRHPYDADLSVYLESPAGVTAELFTNVGGSGDHFIGLTLDDEAATSIASGVAPFTGSYKPESPLTVFDGQNPVGEWKLHVYDGLSGNTGILISWGLCMTLTPPPQPSDYHSADINQDFRITLQELLRLVQFFNIGGYTCDLTGVTEDGYQPGTSMDHPCDPHDSDYQAPFWTISLQELLRLVQFFNMGGYHLCPDQQTADGFCPSLAR